MLLLKTMLLRQLQNRPRWKLLLWLPPQLLRLQTKPWLQCRPH